MRKRGLRPGRSPDLVDDFVANPIDDVEVNMNQSAFVVARCGGIELYCLPVQLLVEDFLTT